MPEAEGPPGWRRVVFLTACTMALCNVDRVLLSVAGLPMAAEFGFNSATMGVLQSSYLWGYGLGQVPSGLLADRFGGPRVLVGGLALWSLATLALPLARSSAAPLAVLTLTRVLFGFGSAVALPAVSATVSRLVPASKRASNLAVIYAAFNMGSLAGMVRACVRFCVVAVADATPNRRAHHRSSPLRAGPPALFCTACWASCGPWWPPRRCRATCALGVTRLALRRAARR